MVVNGESKPVGPRLFFVIYVGRKDHIPYALSHSQVLENYHGLITHHERINSVFAPAIGNYGYILRHTELSPLIEVAGAIQKRSS
jgi:hypothetical protein